MKEIIKVLLNKLKLTSFKQKLTIAFIVTSILPFLLSFLTASYILISYFETNAINSLVTVASEKQYIINSRLLQIDLVSNSLTTYLAKELDITDSEAQNYESLQLITQIKEFISNVKVTNSIYNIRVYSDNLPFISSDHVSLFSLSDFEKLKETVSISNDIQMNKLNTYIINPQANNAQKKISFYRSVKNIDGQIIAIYFIDVYLNDFISNRTKENERINTTLLNTQGVLFSDVELENLSIELTPPFSDKAEHYIAHKTIYVNKPLNYGDWSLLVTTPSYIFYQVNYTLLMVFLISSILSILLSLYAGFASSNILFKRINGFYHKVKNMNFSKNVFDTPMSNHLDELVENNIRGDEIDLLIKSFSELIKQSTQLSESNSQKEIDIQKFKYAVLQEQINPHFLYNALDSIRACMLLDHKSEACNLVEYLSKFYRICLSKGRNAITLKEELDMITQYLRIEQIGYENKISWAIQSDDTLEKALIPKFTLQPIIENAIVHGMNDQIHISIRIIRHACDIMIEINDNGKGMEASKVVELNDLLSKKNIQTNHSSYGLQNVNARIKLFYGEHYGLDVKNNLDKGITTSILCGFKIC